MLKSTALENFLPVKFLKISKSPLALSQNFSKDKTEIYLKGIIFALAALNICVLFAYLYGVNSKASAGYEISRLQANLKQLTEENRLLSLKISETSSMSSIEKDFLGSSFVSAGTPKYLRQNEFTLR